MRVTAVLASLALALGAPHPVLAESPANAAVGVDPVYEQLVLALEGDEQSRLAALDRVLDSVVRQLGESVPPIAQAMKDHPGMAAEIKESMRTPFAAYSDGTRTTLRHDMTVLFAAELPVSEARELALFYNSPLGRRLSASAVSNYDPSRTIKDAAEGKEVKQSSVKDDAMTAGLAGLRDLSPADQKAVVAFAMTPAGQHFNALIPKLVEVRARAENTPMTPEQNAALGAALTPILEKYFGQPATK